MNTVGHQSCKMLVLQVMQQAGIEDEQVVLALEDHQFEGTDFLELINSLLSAGEIPGLYTPEELEPVLAPLRDQASDAGFRGTLAQYFASSKLYDYLYCKKYREFFDFIYFQNYLPFKPCLHVTFLIWAMFSTVSMVTD